MIVTADTNVLLRAILEDDPIQGRIAQEALAAAERVIVPIPTLCEIVWVLSRGYKLRPADILPVLRGILDTENLDLDRGALRAGIAMLERGGDFADGAIAHVGAMAGARAFLTFDRKATGLLEGMGHRVTLLDDGRTIERT
mgnify:CR=1 FL=1